MYRINRICRFIIAGLIIFSLQLYADDSGFGIGFILGSPTGVTGRVMLTDATAIDAGIGDAEGDGFYIYTDYKVDIYSFPDIEYLWLFSGVGFGFHKYKKNFDNPQKDDIDENRTEIRVPFGIAYDFGKLPFGVFFEFIPALQISPDVDFHFRGVLGARYYF